MDNLKVTIIVDENSLPTEGGGYSYYQTLLREIDKHQFHTEIEFSYLLPDRDNSKYPFNKKVILAKESFGSRTLQYLLKKFYSLVYFMKPGNVESLLESITRLKSRIYNRNVIRILKKNNTDLIYYLKPHDYPMQYPMIVTHWDVGHRSMYPFPEVALEINFNKREQYYHKMIHQAMLIFCESEAGARELLRYYPVNAKKIKVLPLFAGEVVNLMVGENEQQEILHKYQLAKDRFFLYPAQFWAHKNHFNLVVAFHRLIQNVEAKNLKLVLCGANQGNMPYIKDLVKSLGLQQEVIFTGFIDNRALQTFYLNALSLVMPTYLGPTNIPLIEAAMLRCAVLCSDFEGHREILGDAALYFDPSRSEQISDAMNLMLDPFKRTALNTAALNLISNSKFHIENSLQILEKLLLEIKPVRKTWGRISGLAHLLTFANFGMINL